MPYRKRIPNEPICASDMTDCLTFILVVVNILRFLKLSRLKSLEKQSKVMIHTVCCFLSNSCILAVEDITWSDSCAILKRLV